MAVGRPGAVAGYGYNLTPWDGRTVGVSFFGCGDRLGSLSCVGSGRL